jgi:hypothetical protein
MFIPEVKIEFLKKSSNEITSSSQKNESIEDIVSALNSITNK